MKYIYNLAQSHNSTFNLCSPLLLLWHLRAVFLSNVGSLGRIETLLCLGVSWSQLPSSMGSNGFIRHQNPALVASLDSVLS